MTEIEPLDARIVALAGAIAAAETELIQRIACDPAQLVPVALDAGVRLDDFAQLDLHGLFAVFVFIAEHPDQNLLAAARTYLSHLGCWNPDGPVHCGAHRSWNRESIEQLIHSWYPHPGAVRQAAQRLLELREKWKTARRYLRALDEALLLEAI